MKNLLLLLAISALTIVSCKKDDPTIQEQILGTWNVSSFIIESEEIVGTDMYTRSEVGPDGTVIQVTYTETTAVTIDFQASNIVVLNQDTEIVKSTGDTLTESEPILGTYTLSDDKKLVLTFSEPDDGSITFDGTISILTDNDLQFGGTAVSDDEPTEQVLFSIKATK